MISALIFPETTLSPADTAQYLLFFDELAYYLATEPAENVPAPGSLLAEFYKGYAPAPLGADLPRFSRLLREMETARSDELARLFAAATVPVTSGPAGDRDETSAASIYGSLHQDETAKKATQHKERLWQARLVLKLAELLDSREAEVRAGLGRIASAEQNMLTALGEGEIPAAAGPEQFSPKPADPLVPLRLKAWAALHLADTFRPGFPVLLADGHESGGTLLDGFENTWKKAAVPLFTLSFPAAVPADQEKISTFLAARNAFREAARENIAHLAGVLQAAAGGVEEFPAAHELAGHAAAWEKKVRDHFREATPGMVQLAFSCFSGVSFAELFHRLFQAKGPAAETETYSTAVLAAPVS
ncbi:MAG: hypothetical protein JRD64_06450 [Deltaproteobacteria bacterium]|jgi:hypothetical protein|nr:hypothetical protein [Deltaproteobacteria bacterium]